MDAAHILIVDDDRDVLETARMFLKQEFTDVQIAERPVDAMALLRKTEFDVILLDMNFRKGVNDGEEGFHWLAEIFKVDPQAVVIPVTAYGDVDIAVKAMKLGATDFVLKPWKNQKLFASILSALQLRRTRKELEKARIARDKLNDDIDQHFSDFIGNSPGIQRVRDMIERVADTDAGVLILGENGTGKELVARALHRRSSRRENAFISVDLGSLTESLFESELFGHVKGAFTDARTDKPGRFEIASGGTLFLDEIGNLSLPLQAKLLAVLQNRIIQRVGSAREIAVDFRLISATNMPLNDMIAEKQFRADLLYRINTVEIRVPPLRERTEDIPLLAEHFLQRYAARYRRIDVKFDKSAMSLLTSYSWPGNIRELQHAVERAVILADGPLVTPDLLFNIPETSAAATPQSLDDAERLFIMQALKDHNGHVSNTAKSLRLTRTALYRRMKKHGIK